MNEFQEMFDRQKALFASGRTRGHAWRVEQRGDAAHYFHDQVGRIVRIRHDHDALSGVCESSE